MEAEPESVDMVGIGKGSCTEPNAPMVFAPRAQDPGKRLVGLSTCKTAWFLVWSPAVGNALVTAPPFWLGSAGVGALPTTASGMGNRHTQHRAQHTADTTHRMNTFRKLMNCV